MEEAERLFQEASDLEAKCERTEASKKYTTFIETVNKLPQPHKTEQLKEKLALAYNNRGFIHYQAVEFEDAISDYTESLVVNPKFKIALYNRGTVLYRLSNFDEAIADLKKSLLLDPTFEPAKIGLMHAEKDRENKLKRGW